MEQCQDPVLQRNWLYLQTSDHFYYMCTKFFSDGDVHQYFNHYPTPYEAYINFMNVISDFRIRLEKHIAGVAAPKKKANPVKKKEGIKNEPVKKAPARSRAAAK
jgi:alpha-amylase